MTITPTAPNLPPVIATGTPIAQGNSAAEESPRIAAPVAASQEAPPVREVNRAEVEAAVEQIRNFVRTAASTLNFAIDNDTGITVITVSDSSTKEIIRQIPSEEVVAIAKALDRFQGLLVRQEA